MGGQLALYAATEFPDLISAAVDFYGIHPNAKIDPDKLRVPVLAHFGKRDTSVPEETANALIESIRARGQSIEPYFYEADHAFFNDTRPEVYDAESADLAWKRTLEFLRRELV
jgi:carboxymethylenebutenolidase